MVSLFPLLIQALSLMEKDAAENGSVLGQRVATEERGFPRADRGGSKTIR
jgi:hypothetical protein